METYNVGANGSNDFRIGNDYFKLEDFPHEFNTSLYIDMYEYGGDGTDMNYITTITGDVTSASFDKDRSSDTISSCSIEMVANKNDYLSNAKSLVWYDKIISVTKTFEFPNDRFYKRNFGTEQGLMYNIENDEIYHNMESSSFIDSRMNINVAKQSLGFYKIDNSSFSYDAQSRNLSLSCSDLITVFGADGGGSLYDYTTGIRTDGLIIEAGDDDFTNNLYYISNRMLDLYSPLYIYKRNIDLYNQALSVPYDLEFDASETLLDVLTKIKSIYSNQYMAFTNYGYFWMGQVPATWVDGIEWTYVLSREYKNLVLSENTTIDLNGMVNSYGVYGKDSNFYGKYTIEDNTNPFSVENIGMRCKNEIVETYTTNKECADAAKWLCYFASQYREVTTITIADSPFSLLHEKLCGATRKIEYTSLYTGETNVYLINKVSHSISDGIWTIEMERFRPLRDEIPYHDFPYRDNTTWRQWYLKPPEFTYALAASGKMILTINNGSDTQMSLYKVYANNIFIGETVDDSVGGSTYKTFSYDFTENGTYMIRVTAYSPQFPPSDSFPSWQVLTEYYVGNVVNLNGNYFKCITTHSSGEEFEDVYWVYYEPSQGTSITISNVNGDRLTDETGELLITENIIDTEYLIK